MRNRRFLRQTALCSICFGAGVILSRTVTGYFLSLLSGALFVAVGILLLDKAT